MRALTILLLCCAAGSAQAQDYGLPFDGRWFVAQGGDTPNVNHHMSEQAQWYGIDFAKVGGPELRALASSEHPDDVTDFYSWGADLLSPADGTIVRVVRDLPDNPLGAKDVKHPAGNHVVLRTAGDRYVFLAHFQQGSIVVREGQRVTRGQQLGRCGNSGNSDFPHVHMHVQDALGEHGIGQNMVFGGIDVLLTGKWFREVDWPLIRGLFVSVHLPAKQQG